MERGAHQEAEASPFNITIWPPRWPGPHWPGTGPYWPFPQLSVGDVHGLLTRGLLKYLDGRRDGDRSLRGSISELVSTGVVGRDEAHWLERIAKIASGDDGARMLDGLRHLQSEMLMRGRPMPSIALAIASIGVDSLGAELAQGKIRLGVAKADLEGGAAGATIGGAIAGPAGAGIGALAGGIALSCIAAREGAQA